MTSSLAFHNGYKWAHCHVRVALVPFTTASCSFNTTRKRWEQSLFVFTLLSAFRRPGMPFDLFNIKDVETGCGM